MQLMKGQVVDLEITKLAFGGRGIGEYDGLKVFVPGVMPGDKVKASFTRLKKNYAEAKLVEITEFSKDRAKEKCKYSGTCGGCQLQFMPYEQQLAYKKQHVIDCFERIGGIKGVEVAEVIASKDVFYYRNKMEFSFGYDEEMNFTLGMHVPGRRFDIMDLTECHLQSEVSFGLLNDVREFFMGRDILPFKYSDGSGVLKALVIREGKKTGERMVILRTSQFVPEDFDVVLREFVEMVKDRCSSIYWNEDISVRGKPREVREHHLYGETVLHEKMVIEGDELSFDVSPRAFFQVNLEQAEVLYSQVLELALRDKHEMVFDLFCGTGTIGLFLAKHVKKVLGIELNASAVEVAKENAAKNGVSNVEFFVGDVAKVMGYVDSKPDLIVLDPPRAGLFSEKVVEDIAAFDCKRIVYVSCNPSTLARDCAWLSEYGYKVKEVRPVDMFPHTFHIENVCLLEKEMV